MQKYSFEEIKKALKTLDVPPLSTFKEIKDNYKKLAKKYHPDICKKPECEEKFKEVNKAYKILEDYCLNYRYKFTEKEFNERFPAGFVISKFF